MPQRLAELWYGVDVSATNSTRRLLPPLGLVSKLNCLTPLSGPCTTWLPRSTLRPMCNQAATLHSQTSVQLECHTPLSGLVCKLDCYTYSLAKTRTATRALWEQLLLLPLPMLLASYWLSSTLRADSSARDWDRKGLLEEIPRSGVQISASTKRATIGVRAPYATRRKLRYEANQVWMNTTFISQGPQSSGI